MARSSNAGARKGKGKAASRAKPTPKTTAAPKRPAEIGAGQWAKLGERQRKRYAAFYKNPAHRGLPLYRARGKQAAEHLTRKERENARMEARARLQAYRGADSGARPWDEIYASYQRMGYSRFLQIERKINDLNNQWLDVGRPFSGTAHSLGLNIGDEFDEFDYADYDIEDSELFYH